MDTLNRSASALLARVICEDIIRWEPDAYKAAFESGRVEEELAENIEAGRAIFLSRAPAFGDLFELALRTCLVEGDFEGFALKTGDVQAASSASRDEENPPEAIAPGTGFELAAEVSALTTLTRVRLTPSETNLDAVASLQENPTASARVSAVRARKQTWVIELKGALIEASASAHLSPEKGFFNQLKKRTFGEIEIGHPSVDDAFIIRAGPESVAMLVRLVDPLSRLSDPAPEIRIDREQMSAYVEVEGARKAAQVIDALFDLWTKEQSARLMASF